MNKNKKLALLIRSILIILILIISGIYFHMLCTRYPEIEINQGEFYGSGNQNLKDFDLEDGKLISLSGDPWVTWILDERVNIKLIEIDIDDFERNDLYMEVFDMEDWTSKRARLHNGKVLLFYKDDQGQNKKELRFDLVEEPNVSLSVSSVTINSKYGMLYYTVIHFVPLMVGILLIEVILFAIWDVGSKTATTKGWKVYYGSWIAVQILIVIVTFVVSIFQNLNSIELIWLWIVCLMEVFLAVTAVLQKMKSGIYWKSVARLAQIACFILISFGQLEILSGIGYNFRNISSALWNIAIILFMYLVDILVARNRESGNLEIGVPVLGNRLFCA